MAVYFEVSSYQVTDDSNGCLLWSQQLPGYWCFPLLKVSIAQMGNILQHIMPVRRYANNDAIQRRTVE